MKNTPEYYAESQAILAGDPDIDVMVGYLIGKNKIRAEIAEFVMSQLPATYAPVLIYQALKPKRKVADAVKILDIVLAIRPPLTMDIFDPLFTKGYHGRGEVRTKCCELLAVLQKGASPGEKAGEKLAASFDRTKQRIQGLGDRLGDLSI